MITFNELFAVRRAGRALVATTAMALVFAGQAIVAPAQAVGADVSVEKTAPDVPYSPGSTIEYTITVENNGPASASQVQVVDNTPPNTTFVSVTAPLGWNCAAPAPGGTGQVTCTTGNFPEGSVAELTLTVRITNNAFPDTEITNTATVSSNTPDPLPENNSSSHTIVIAGADTDTAGVYDMNNAAFFLKNTNMAGPADITFVYGPGGGTLLPIVGDWDGNGQDTIGIYNTVTGAFFLKNTNMSGPADIVFTYGAGGPNILPITGDWNGDGIDTVGLYDQSTAAFFLRNSNSAGPADIVFTYGPVGNFTPLAGDWNGNGVDTIGIFDPATATFFLKNTNMAGGADLAFNYGSAFQTPVTGDWDGDNVDTVGVVSTGSASWFLRNSNSAGPANIVFSYGFANATPIVGDWNGL